MNRARTCALLGAALVVPRPSPASAADAVPFKLGTMLLDASGEGYYGADQGFFAASGLDVKINVMNNGAAILAAVMSGNLDAGFASPASLTLARSRGIAARFVAPAAIYVGPEPNTGLMVLKDGPIASARDLTGKTIAVAGLKDITQFMTQAWLDRNGGDAQAVQFTELPYAEMAIALQQNRVAAACLVEPYLSAAKTSARTLANLNLIFGKRYLIAGWFSSDDWIARNGATLERFRAALRDTARWANGHHPESGVILAKYTKLTPEQLATLQRSQYDEGTRIDPAMIRPAVDVIVKYGKLPPVSVGDLIAR